MSIEPAETWRMTDFMRDETVPQMVPRTPRLHECDLCGAAPGCALRRIILNSACLLQIYQRPYRVMGGFDSSGRTRDDDRIACPPSGSASSAHILSQHMPKTTLRATITALLTALCLLYSPQSATVCASSRVAAGQGCGASRRRPSSRRCESPAHSTIMARSQRGQSLGSG